MKGLVLIIIRDGIQIEGVLLMTIGFIMMTGTIASLTIQTITVILGIHIIIGILTVDTTVVMMVSLVGEEEIGFITTKAIIWIITVDDVFIRTILFIGAIRIVHMINTSTIMIINFLIGTTILWLGVIIHLDLLNIVILMIIEIIMGNNS